MFRDYFVFRYKVNGKLALICHKDKLNENIKFLSSKLKALTWECYFTEELKGKFNEKELKEYDIELTEV